MRWAVIIFLFSLPFTSVAAQTVLQPGEITFGIDSIILTPVCEDYTGQCEEITLRGDLNYLTIGWNATYFSGAERDIGAKCYLNCESPGEDIETNCAAEQNCGYVGPPGERGCSIVNPNYLYKEPNNVTCKFYDPEFPELEFLPYPNRTFEAIDFSIFILPATITVGEPFSIPINVEHLGLIADNFTINVTALGLNPNLVTIEGAISTTEQLSYGQIGTVYPKITILASIPDQEIVLKILTKSGKDPTTCAIDDECSYLGPESECVGKRCWKRFDAWIRSGLASLPQFGLSGLILLIAATLVFVWLWV